MDSITTLPQQPRVQLICNTCGRHFHGFTQRCTCGGITETVYTPLDRGEDRHDFYRRFAPVLPLNYIDDLPAIDLVSPTIRADKLTSLIGGPEIWLKDEGALPTGSTKARVGALVLPFLLEQGVTHFAVSSTGNTSSAIAWAARYFPQATVHIFVGRDFVGRLREVSTPNVHVHLVRGNFVEAGKAAQEFATEQGMAWEGGFFNPARRDALKTAFIEAVDDMGESPSMYVQAVSSAMGVVGTVKGARELPFFGHGASKPRLLCVQQETCAPIVSAWRANSLVIRDEDRVENPKGIAEAILRGDPSGAYPILRPLVQDSGGDCVAVTDWDIREAQNLLRETESVIACEAGASALAGYIQYLSDNPAVDGPVLLNITGRRQTERWPE